MSMEVVQVAVMVVELYQALKEAASRAGHLSAAVGFSLCLTLRDRG
jgi:hypothetical protein